MSLLSPPDPAAKVSAAILPLLRQPAELTPNKLARIRALSRTAPVPAEALWELLGEQLEGTPGQCLRQLGRLLGLETADLAQLRRVEAEFGVLPHLEATRRLCLLARDGAELVGFTTDPFNLSQQSLLEMRASAEGLLIARWRLVHPDDLRLHLAALADGARTLGGSALPMTVEAALAALDGDKQPFAAWTSRQGQSTAHLLNSIVLDALQAAASDIHMESTGGGLAIKYRIDGVLNQVALLSGAEVADQLLARIKTLAELDGSEHHLPQDGRFRFSLQGRQVDFKVALMPSLLGEDAVIRIIDSQSRQQQAQRLQLAGLGFDPALIAALRKLAREPAGLVLVAGPPGSGRSASFGAGTARIADAGALWSSCPAAAIPRTQRLSPARAASDS